jgi:hypothetical protein
VRIAGITSAVKLLNLIFGNDMDSEGDKNMKLSAGISILAITLSFGCKKPYAPKIIATSGNYLVVESVINTGTDSTSVRLSRTVPLSSTTGAKAELGANVIIITNTGGNYPLSEKGNGYYKGPGLNSGSPDTYSLKIATSDGKIYQSDFVQAKNSPPIDSVYYRVQNSGVNIYADTHDPSGKSTYYRWDYIETYKYHSAFQSFDSVVTAPKDTIVPRNPAYQTYTCYRSDTSSSIVLNSSAKLAKDIIANNQVTSIISSSEKIEDEYSILVRQYALTPDAFNYYQQLKKNTEQLGSIFDAQPSELPGNIHCTSNPGEAVIGYITAGVPAETRIFIYTKNLPNWQPITPYTGCIMDTALFCAGPGCENQVKDEIFPGYETPLYPVGYPIIIGYAISGPVCVDCTLRGTTKQPGFWRAYGQ